MSDVENPYLAPTTSPAIEANPIGGAPYEPLKQTAVLGKTVQVLLALIAILTTVIAVASYYCALKFEQDINPFRSLDDTGTSDLYTMYMGVVGLLGLVTVVHIVVFCIWTHRSMSNAWKLHTVPGIPSMSPGWAVGWYFIPIAMLWKPYQGMKEIWQATFPNKYSARLLGWWWGLWLASNFSNQITSKLPSETLEDFEFTFMVEALTSPLTIVAAFLLFTIVGRVTKEQMKHAA